MVFPRITSSNSSVKKKCFVGNICDALAATPNLTGYPSLYRATAVSWAVFFFNFIFFNLNYFHKIYCKRNIVETYSQKHYRNIILWKHYNNITKKYIGNIEIVSKILYSEHQNTIICLLFKNVLKIQTFYILYTIYFGCLGESYNFEKEIKNYKDKCNWKNEFV